MVMKGARLRFVRLLPALAGAAFFAVGLGVAGVATAQERAPHWATPANHVGAAAEADRVSIVAFLSFRNQQGLKNLIAAQSDPSSAQYGKYLTPDEFHALFSPRAADVKRVQTTLEKLGFHVDATPASGLFVEASGTVAQVKASFAVTQELYSYKGLLLRSNAETPSIPAAIADVVTYVAGLDQRSALRKPNHIRLNETASESAPARTTSAAPASVSGSAPPPVAAVIPSPVCSTYWGDHTATLSSAPAPYSQTLPWLVCGYTPQQIRAAYGSDKVSQDGSGVRVGIVDLYASPTIVEDANRYSRKHALPRLTQRNFRQIVPAGLFDVPASDPCGPQGWYEEETLDVEAVHSVAPGAAIVFAGDTCTDPVNSPLYNLIDNHLVDIVTNSYSYNGEFLDPAGLAFEAAEDQYFLQAAAEGISLLFSTGDNGDLAAFNGYASGTWDSTSPYVTAVGGTSLALFDRNGTKKEWGWGNYRAYLGSATVSPDGTSIATTGAVPPFSYYAGSGGGPSVFELAPSYQAAVPYRLAGYTTLADGTEVPLGAAYRVTPDISMVGDPYTGFLVGETNTIAGDPVTDAGCTPLTSTTEYCEVGVGGTSLSSPLFAGVLALANQARFQAHKGPVGLVNPALYAMARGDTSAGAPIVDVNRPSSPTALLRGYLGNPNRVRVVTINSYPNPNYVPGDEGQPAVIEGADTSYRTTRGYDNVTGLGTPNVPALIETFLKY